MAGAIVQVLLAWFNERSTNPPLVQANRAAIGAQQYIDGTLRSAEVIEAMGMLRHIHRRWMDKQRDFLSLQAQASDKGGTFQSGQQVRADGDGVGVAGPGRLAGIAEHLGRGRRHDDRGLGAGRTHAGSTGAGGEPVACRGEYRDAWRRLDGLLAMVPESVPGMSLPAPRGMLSVEQVVAAAGQQCADSAWRGQLFAALVRCWVWWGRRLRARRLWRACW